MDEIEKARTIKEMREDIDAAKRIAREICDDMESAVNVIDDSAVGKNIKAATILSEAGLPYNWGQIMGVLLADAARKTNKQATMDYVSSLLDILIDANQKMGGNVGS